MRSRPARTQTAVGSASSARRPDPRSHREPRLPAAPPARIPDLAAEWLRYHRVLTDAAGIVSRRCGDFRHTVDIEFT
jgi:hypothetical protein